MARTLFVISSGTSDSSSDGSSFMMDSIVLLSEPTSGVLMPVLVAPLFDVAVFDLRAIDLYTVIDNINCRNVTNDT